MGKVQSTVEQLQKLVPKLAKEKRHISKILYQKLALGSSVSIEAIAIELHKSPQEVKDHLGKMEYVEYSASGEILAYRGVTLNQTKHLLLHNNAKIYTWCAFDTLFLAELLIGPVSISSSCPTCHKTITCEVTNGVLTTLNRTETVMSFIIPSKEDYFENLRSAFCCKVHFFCDEQCGNGWENLLPEIDFIGLAESLVIAVERNRYFLGKT
jgi:alkylmercury lyase